MIATLVRILTFRATHEELSGLGRRHLALGLVLTWLVGIGRWWEDPRANLLQHLGVGSLVYVFLLALLLWLVIWPLAPRRPSYLSVLTFVTLTAPPGFLYAVPVRSWFDLATAQELRLWFLAIVATWRVLLWVRYLVVGVKLWFPAALVAGLLPLTFIVVALFLLNLERVAFDLMGGVQRGDANEKAYAVLFLLSYFSVMLFIPLAVAYAVFANFARRARRAATGEGA